ncbi:hypothetical protein [Micromonospora sp. WMMD998]|uniref:hypothetical protein n=1 Tax=Micromonospora sp. WMMD998 TaxID=3016092 RepID=UPI00249BCF8B|nr:hypothetical protein [Micromonospora sp. WMMD998]WFE41613.1 hypothetical protein O7619_25415 [Micromonospora sp. WMMD998]
MTLSNAGTGDKREREHHLTVDVPPGTYLIRTAYVEPEDGTALVLVQLADQTLAA